MLKNTTVPTVFVLSANNKTVRKKKKIYIDQALKERRFLGKKWNSEFS